MRRAKTEAAPPAGETVHAEFAKTHRIRLNATQHVRYDAGFKGQIPVDHHAHAQAKGALVDAAEPPAAE